jgi:hypothetical protein
MAALPAEATRQPRGVWPLRYSALATDRSYRLTKMESGDVGCAATSAKRHSAGSAHGMTALVEVTDTYRAPKGRQCLPPSRKPITPLRSTFYMLNRPLAPVENAQAAIKSVANDSRHQLHSLAIPKIKSSAALLSTAKTRLRLVASIKSSRLISLPTSRITSMRPKSIECLAANCTRPFALA